MDGILTTRFFDSPMMGSTRPDMLLERAANPGGGGGLGGVGARYPFEDD